MAGNKRGSHTLVFKNKPAILSASAMVGPKEAGGPFKEYFKYVLTDDTFGQDSFEKTEREMLIFAIKNTIEKAGLDYGGVDLILGGDLLNQLISATFSAREFQASFIGLYSACSTYTESLLLGAALVDGGYKNNAVCCTVSHFSSVERQYRFPLEFGSMRTPASQWTVTGSAACMLGKKPGYPYIQFATSGKVIDYGVNDANNMGAAMAPAAMDTAVTHFHDTNRTPENYDRIITGDLGILGSKLFLELMAEKGYDLGGRYFDCGAEIFEKKPLLHQGGSGPACSAAIFNAYIYEKMLKKEFKRVLYIATGALLSTTSSQQGDSIPGIAHAVALKCADS